MTIRELEEIESGLKILSYECDDLLADKIYGNRFFDFYFQYSGYIGALRRVQWTFPNIRQTIARFPRITQPGLFVLVPFLLYSAGLFFATSLITIFIYMAILCLAFSGALLYVRKKIRKDLVQVVHLCSELRRQLNEIKRLRHRTEINLQA